MSDDLDYIRGRYGVPAERGRRITFRWRNQDGTILGAQPNARHYLSVLLDGDAEPVILHPTWEVVYHNEIQISGASRREQRMSYRSASSRAAAFNQALREAMRSSVTERLDVEGTPASDPSAGTASPERIPVERVASVTTVSDTGLKTDDRNGVEHTRKARLRRWQETRG